MSSQSNNGDSLNLSGNLDQVADDAMKLIRLNLLILGVLAPILSTISGQEVKFTNIINNQFGQAGILTWIVSMVVAIRAYRRGRRDAFANLEGSSTTNSAVLLDELFAYNSVAVGFSITSVIFFLSALVSYQSDISYIWINTIFAGTFFGFILIVGQDFITFLLVTTRKLVNNIPFSNIIRDKMFALSAIIPEILSKSLSNNILQYQGKIDESNMDRLVNQVQDEVSLPKDITKMLVLIFILHKRDSFSLNELKKEFSEYSISIDKIKIQNLIQSDLLVRSSLNSDEEEFKLTESSLEILRRSSDILHYHQMEQRRQQYFESGKYYKWIGSTLSKIVTGYGNSASRVVLTSQTIIFLFALVYSVILNSDGLSLYHPIQYLYLSMQTFTLIGDPSIQATGIITYLFFIESILGAFLLTLFVFVFGRKISY